MRKKFYVILLAAVFCVNSMTVFAEGQKIEQEGNTEIGEVKETAQTENTEAEKGTAEKNSEAADPTASAGENLPKIGGGGRSKA